MDDQDGGIGGAIGDTGRRVPRHVEAERGPDITSSDEGAPHHGPVVSTAMVEAVGALAGRVATLTEENAQLRGQIAQLEQDQRADRGSIQAVFNQIDARLNAMAQRLGTNERYLAAELAVRARQPGERIDAMLKNAEGLLGFIAPAAVEVTPAVEDAQESATGEAEPGPQVH